jgi:hypothetical protein
MGSDVRLSTGRVFCVCMDVSKEVWRWLGVTVQYEQKTAWWKFGVLLEMNK